MVRAEGCGQKGVGGGVGAEGCAEAAEEPAAERGGVRRAAWGCGGVTTVVTCFSMLGSIASTAAGVSVSAMQRITAAGSPKVEHTAKERTDSAPPVTTVRSVLIWPAREVPAGEYLPE